MPFVATERKVVAFFFSAQRRRKQVNISHPSSAGPLSFPESGVCRNNLIWGRRLLFLTNRFSKNKTKACNSLHFRASLQQWYWISPCSHLLLFPYHYYYCCHLCLRKGHPNIKDTLYKSVTGNYRCWSSFYKFQEDAYVVGLLFFPYRNLSISACKIFMWKFCLLIYFF